MPVSTDPKELERLTSDELLELKLELEGDLSSIRTQIAAAQQKAREQGEYADSQWWLKVNWALKTKGRQCQEIQLLLRRRKTQAVKTSVESEFVTLARAKLPPEQFNSLLQEAKEHAGL